MASSDQAETLLRYDVPIVVSADEGVTTAEVPGLTAPVSASPQHSMPSLQAPTKTREEVMQQRPEDILNNMFPPRKWMKGSQLWVQRVSHAPCKRLDVVVLEEKFERKLHEQQARKTGICPIRMEIYSECFDELLRQVTIDCPERGMLLEKVRGEIEMTVAAYQTLYENSIIYGIKKARQSEQLLPHLKSKIVTMEKEIDKLKVKVEEQKNRYDAYVKVEDEKRVQMEKPYHLKIDFLEKLSQQIKDQREEIDKPFPTDRMDEYAE